MCPCLCLNVCIDRFQNTGVRVCACMWLCICVLFAVARHLGTINSLISAALLCMYMCYVYDCVIGSFLLLLFISIRRPLFRNFGRTFVFVCAHARACVFVCVLKLEFIYDLVNA